MDLSFIPFMGKKKGGSELSGDHKEYEDKLIEYLTSPSQIIQHPKEIQITKYHRVISAINYPRLVDPGWLTRLIEMNLDFDLAIHIIPYTVESTIKLLKAGTILFKVTDRDGNPSNDLHVHIPITGGKLRIKREKGVPKGLKPVPGSSPFIGGDEVDMEKISKGQFRVYSLTPGEHVFSLDSSAGSKSRLKVAVQSGKETVVAVVLE